MAKPLVSIITPTFNHERFIGWCIDSVLAQSYPGWEMIIVDDGSTDRTRDVVASYHDSRIRHFHQQNRGIWQLKETYNFALEQSRGEIIAILEGDDCWPEWHLESQIAVFADSHVVLCYGRFLRIGEDSQLLDKNPRPFSNNVLTQTSIDVLRGLLTGDLTIMPVTALIKRDSLESIGGFQQPSYYPAVEHPTWLSLAKKGNFCFLDSLHGYWRRHIGQANHQLGVQLAQGLSDYNKEFFERLEEKIRNQVAISSEQLHKLGFLRVADAHFSVGRYRLVDGDKMGARQSFRTAFKQGNVKIKMKASLGLVASAIGLSLEKLVSAVGQSRYR